MQGWNLDSPFRVKKLAHNDYSRSIVGHDEAAGYYHRSIPAQTASRHLTHSNPQRGEGGEAIPLPLYES